MAIYQKRHVYIIQKETNGNWRVTQIRANQGVNYSKVDVGNTFANKDAAIQGVFDNAKAIVGSSDNGEAAYLAVAGIVHVPRSELDKLAADSRRRIIILSQDVNGTWRRGVAQVASDASPALTHGTGTDMDTVRLGAVANERPLRVWSEVHVPATAFSAN